MRAYWSRTKNSVELRYRLAPTRHTSRRLGDVDSPSMFIEPLTRSLPRELGEVIFGEVEETEGGLVRRDDRLKKVSNFRLARDCAGGELSSSRNVVQKRRGRSRGKLVVTATCRPCTNHNIDCANNHRTHTERNANHRKRSCSNANE